MISIARFDRTENMHRGDIRARKRAVVHDLLDARAGGRDLRGEISQATRPIADHRREARKPPVSDEPALDDATQNVWIDIPAAEKKNNPLARELRQLSRETGGQRRRGSAFDNALLQLDDSQDR